MPINRKKIIWSAIFLLFAIIYNSNALKVIHFFIRRQNFKGKIIRKELTSGRKHTLIYLLDKNQEEFYDIGNDSVYNIVQIGDYIIKKRGNLYYTLVKNTDTIILYQ